jgi:MFS family permease
MIVEVIEVAPPPSRGRLAAIGGASTAVGRVLADCVIAGIKLAEFTMMQWRWGFRLSLLLGVWPALTLLAVLPWWVGGLQGGVPGAREGGPARPQAAPPAAHAARRPLTPPPPAPGCSTRRARCCSAGASRRRARRCRHCGGSFRTSGTSSNP